MSSTSPKTTYPTVAEPSMARSRRPQSKCFSGILRRILCTGSLPTHPSDQVSEPTSTPEIIPFPIKRMKNAGEPNHEEDDASIAESTTAASAPGIVARLMGLDSIPSMNIRWDPKKGTCPDSLLGRSRSMNSLEYLMQFERMQSSENSRARTSSFREVPTFLFPHKDQDPVLFLSNETQKGDLRKQRKTEVGSRETKQRITGRRNRGDGGIKNERDQLKNQKVSSNGKKGDRVMGFSGDIPSKIINSSDGFPQKSMAACRQSRPVSKAKQRVKPIMKKESCGRTPEKKKKRRSNRGVNNVIPDCNGEFLKSVSVLGSSVDSFQPDQIPLSEEQFEETRLEMRMEEMMPTSKKVEKSEYPFQNHRFVSSMDENYERKSMDYVNEEEMRINYPGLEAGYYREMITQICRMADEDLEKTKWVGMQRLAGAGFEDHEEMCREFGEQIVEQLVCQTVDELFGISH